VNFVEVVTWEIREGSEAEHHEMMRTWFRFVRDNHPAMFAEWKGARYYRETNRDGAPTGRYIMVFEFHTHEGYLAYKTRRAGYPGPYQAYEKVDPYQFFQEDRVRVRHWEPQETDL
jgi:hypothetical protein